MPFSIEKECKRTKLFSLCWSEKVLTRYYKYTKTYITPLDEGLSWHAKNRITGRLRERPAFQDIVLDIIGLMTN